jgi:hypothetical protein
MKYNLKYANSSGDIGTYRCPYYRRGCKAALTLDTHGNIVERSTQHLDPDCYVRNAAAAPNSNQEPIPDITDEMKEYVDCQALLFLTKIAETIAKECLEKMKKLHGERFTGLSKQQMTARVYDTRRRSGGGVEKKRIETQHMNSGKSSFCRGQHNFIDPKTGERLEVMLFGKKPLLDRNKEV